VIEKLRSQYGFSRTPFGRALAPQMLHRHGAHAEAVARLDWCISERGLGVVTAKSAPARRWPSEPPSPVSTPAGTR